MRRATAQRGRGMTPGVRGVHDVASSIFFIKASAGHAPRVGCERRRARITSLTEGVGRAYTVHTLIVCMSTTRQQEVNEQDNQAQDGACVCTHLRLWQPIGAQQRPEANQLMDACHSGNSDCVSLHDALFESPYLRKPVTGQRPQHKYVMRPGRQYLANGG